MIYRFAPLGKIHRRLILVPPQNTGNLKVNPILHQNRMPHLAGVPTSHPSRQKRPKSKST